MNNNIQAVVEVVERYGFKKTKDNSYKLVLDKANYFCKVDRHLVSFRMTFTKSPDIFIDICYLHGIQNKEEIEFVFQKLYNLRYISINASLILE